MDLKWKRYLHGKLWLERWEWGKGPWGEDDGADSLRDQVLHAESRTEAPVAQHKTWQTKGKTYQ